MYDTFDKDTSKVLDELLDNPPKKVNLIFETVPTYFASLSNKDVITTDNIFRNIISNESILDSIEKNFGTKESRRKLVNYLFLEHLLEDGDDWEVYARDQEMIFYKPKVYSIINTVGEFLEYVLEIDSEDIGGELLFRGQENVDWSLVPSLFRDEQVFSEGEFYYQAKLREPKEFNNSYTIDDIVKMQHYFLPTRLLDLTYNPLIALYFACLDSDKYIKNHGVVHTFIEYVYNAYDSDEISLLASCVNIRKPWNTEREFIINLIEANRKNGENYNENTVSNIIGRNYFINASSHNERIKRQQGAFIIFGMDFSNENCLCKDASEKVRKGFIVPQRTKVKMLKSLEMLGINEAFIYPELEHQANFIKKRYKKKGHYQGSGSNNEDNQKSEKLSPQEMQKLYTEQFDNKIKELSLYYGFDEDLINNNKEIISLINTTDWYSKEIIKSNIKSIFARILAKTSLDQNKQNAAKVSLAMFFMEINK